MRSTVTFIRRTFSSSLRKLKNLLLNQTQLKFLHRKSRLREEVTNKSDQHWLPTSFTCKVYLKILHIGYQKYSANPLWMIYSMYMDISLY